MWDKIKPYNGNDIDKSVLNKKNLDYILHIVPLSTLTYLVTATGVAFLLRNRVSRGSLVFWFTSVAVITLSRFILSVIFNRMKERPYKQFHFIFIYFTAMSALVWGFSGFILLTDDTSSNMFLIVCILGIGSGGTITLASDLKQVVMFQTSLFIPFITRLFLFNSEYYISAAVLILIYYFMILGAGIKIYKIINENMIYSWKNKQTMNELSASEKKFRTIFNQAPIGIFYYNSDLVVYDCNREFCIILETTRERMMNFNMNDVRDKRILKSINDAFKGETGYYEGEYHTTISNSKIWVNMKCSPVYDRDGLLSGAVGIIQDRTEYKLIEEKVRHLAYHDSLTGLPNRMLLKDRASQALSQSRRNRYAGAILFLDLDNFKVINDTLGHHAGDKMLVETADRLNNLVRAEDTVSRIGGDEFVVLLPRLQKSLEEAIISAGTVADKIHDVLKQPYKIVEKTLYTSTSIGIALFSEKDSSIEDLLKNADTAMYEAKKEGRSCTHFYNKEMNTSIMKRMKMENSLRKAVENREFVLNFQPIYDISEKKYTGAETLIRWNHPEWGIVSPADFIPLAEETGLIIPIGEWLIEEVCRRLADWNRRYNNPIKYISINISVNQLKQDSFPETVIRNLNRYNIPPEMIVLEITENVLIGNFEKASETISSLRKHDISFALDDFGTGYSSLTYLKNLSLDIIKIDRSFIQDIINDRNDSALVEAILSISGNFDISVVAEGVEEAEQVEKLSILGCRYLQGYYYSRPLPAEEFGKILNSI